MAQRKSFAQNDLDTVARLFNAENGNSNQQVATILGCGTRSVTNFLKKGWQLTMMILSKSKVM